MSLRSYRFEGFRLDVATRELRCPDGKRTLLPAQVFDGVLHLIENRDRAVGRDELIAVVWNRSEVGDNVLAQLLARIRKIFDDTGERQRIVRTIPGFGYHWIAPTQEETARIADSPNAAGAVLEGREPDAVRAGDEPAAEAPPPAAFRFRVRWLPLLALVAIAIAIAVRIAMKADVPAAPVAGDGVVRTNERPTLVLPAIVDSSLDQEWLQLGVMALVSERLAQAGIVLVPADNVIALSRGAEAAALDERRLSALRDSSSAGRIIVIEVRNGQPAARWRVSLSVRSSDSPQPSITVDGEEIVETSNRAVDRLIAALGVGSPPATTSSDPELTLLLKRAQADYLAGRHEAAREQLVNARARYGGSPDIDYQIAWIDYLGGKIDAAQAQMERLLASDALAEEQPVRARALNALANIRYQRRDFAAVESYSRQVISELESRPDLGAELGRAWRGLARAESALGNVDASLADTARARVILAAAGDGLGVALTDANAGIVLRRADRLHESLPVLERAADRLRQFHAFWDEGVARAHLIAALRALSESDAALVQSPRLTELDALIEHGGMRAALRLTHADMLLDSGQIARARALAGSAYRQIIAADDRINLFLAHTVAGRLALASGDAGEARSELEQALATLYDSEEDPREVAWTHLLLARLQMQEPLLPERTRAALKSRLDLWSWKAGEVYTDLLDAEIAAARGDEKTAQAAFENALNNPHAAKIDRFRVVQACVPWLLGRGSIDRAAELMGSLGDLPTRDFNAALLEARLYEAQGLRTAWQAAIDRARALAGDRAVPTAPRPLRSGAVIR